MITEMEKSMLRKKMLEACIEHKQLVVEDFKVRMSAILEAPVLENEEEYDNSVLAYQSQYREEIEALDRSLKQAVDDMNKLLYLKYAEATNHIFAELGAIVITDRNIFFVSVGIDELKVEGGTFMAISPQSPLYQAMKGLSKNNSFNCKGINYMILDIL